MNGRGEKSVNVIGTRHLITSGTPALLLMVIIRSNRSYADNSGQVDQNHPLEAGAFDRHRDDLVGNRFAARHLHLKETVKKRPDAEKLIPARWQFWSPTKS